MNTDTFQVTLPESGNTATLRKSITYGEAKKIEVALFNAAKSDIQGVAGTAAPKVNAQFDGAGMVEWGLLKLETYIKSITGVDGKESPINRKLLEGLSEKDGKCLEEEVAELMGESKKKSEETETK